MFQRIGLGVAALLCAACALSAAEDTVQSATFDSAGVTIHYVLAGKGEPVVLIHGLFSSAAMNWQLPGTFKTLAASYQVIAPDVRGHGKSDKPTTDDAYGLQTVEDVTRLLDHLHLPKAHIVGYSMGGMIALKFISLHPDRVLSGTLGGMGWLKEGGVLERLFEHSDEKSAASAACIRGFSQLALSENALKAIRAPVAVLVGDRDPCKQLYVAPLEAVRKDWPVTEIKDAGHLNCVIKPQFIAELKNWLDKNAKAATK